MQPAFSIQPSRPFTDLIQQARQGVLRRRVDEVAGLVGLTDKEMARILNMSVRGLHGKDAAELLTSAASERLLLLERLIQHGLTIFDGRADLLARWLRTPLAELAYREGVGETAKQSASEALSVKHMGSFNEPGRPVSAGSLQPVRRGEHFGSPNSINEEQLSVVVPQSPLAVLDTVLGFSLAEDVLGRIEWGIIG